MKIFHYTDDLSPVSSTYFLTDRLFGRPTEVSHGGFVDQVRGCVVGFYIAPEITTCNDLDAVGCHEIKIDIVEVYVSGRHLSVQHLDLGVIIIGALPGYLCRTGDSH